MPLDIVTPSEADASTTVTVHLEAMDADILTNAQFPNPESKEFLARYLHQSAVHHMQDNDKGILMAVDVESGEVASSIKWVIYRNHNQEEAKSTEGDEWPPSCRKEYLDPYASMTEQLRGRIMGDRPYFHVTYLCTRPTWSRQGAASALMRRVQQLATTDNMSIILEATPGAVGLYQKLGFQTRETLTMILPPIGLSEPTCEYSEECMVWTPPNGW